MGRALRYRIRRQHGRRLLRFDDRPYPRPGYHASPEGGGRLSSAAGRTESRMDAVAGLALQPGGAAPGKRDSVDRRALQRQRQQEVPRPSGGGGLGRLRRDRPRTDSRGQPYAGCLHRLRRPRRGRRHDRDGLAAAWRGRCAAGDRFHRTAGAGRRAATGRRQARHQLDQFRERRGGSRGAPRTGAQAWRRGDRADHRRGRHGEDRGRKAAHRRTALRHGGERIRPAAVGPAVRPV